MCFDTSKECEELFLFCTYLVHVCTCFSRHVYMCAHATAGMWRSEGTSEKSILSSHHVSSGGHSGHSAWWAASLATEPCPWPECRELPRLVRRPAISVSKVPCTINCSPSLLQRASQSPQVAGAASGFVVEFLTGL